MKKILTFATIIMSFLALSVSVHADAKSEIRSKLVSVTSKYTDSSYKIVDIDKDGKVEGIAEFHAPGYGSARTFQIYKYKSGKVVRVLNDYVYGLSKFTVYKKGIIAYGAGHGGEWYRYYKLTNGKYKLKGVKSRVARAGGGAYNGPWAYSNGKKTITKAAFDSAIKGIKKGKKKTVKPY